jgi:hypothetical protein
VGIGVTLGTNLNNPAGQYTPPDPGLTYAVSALPSEGLSIVLGVVEADGGKVFLSYSIPAGALEGTVPWASFGLTDTPTLGAVSFQPNPGSVAMPFNFCVTSLEL